MLRLQLAHLQCQCQFNSSKILLYRNGHTFNLKKSTFHTPASFVRNTTPCCNLAQGKKEVLIFPSRNTERCWSQHANTRVRTFANHIRIRERTQQYPLLASAKMPDVVGGLLSALGVGQHQVGVLPLLTVQGDDVKLQKDTARTLQTALVEERCEGCIPWHSWAVQEWQKLS